MRRAPGSLRIIGGQWRSRLIRFASDAGVRPTPDRVRQTVFDWLSPLIEGACCLDLFAGSGALGLEALSRGAQSVVFIDASPVQIAAIRTAIAGLAAADRSEAVQADALDWLPSPRGTLNPARFDLVFVDPPYAQDLLGKVLQVLPQRLAPSNRIYLEWLKGARPPLPAGYDWLKEKAAGQVSYGLVQYTGWADEEI